MEQNDGFALLMEEEMSALISFKSVMKAVQIGCSSLAAYLEARLG